MSGTDPPTHDQSSSHSVETNQLRLAGNIRLGRCPDQNEPGSQRRQLPPARDLPG